MIVGEAPGAIEEAQGRPFVGPAGQLLRKFLFEAGIDPESVYYTNICKYRPPGNKLNKFFGERGRPNDLIGQGLLELMLEIETIKPNVIVACGNFPLWALTGEAEWRQASGEIEAGYTGIVKWRGSILPSRLGINRKVVPTYHPSYINQEGYSAHGIFRADLSRVKEQAEFPEIRPLSKEILIDPRGAPWLEARAWLLDDPNAVITADIEYIGDRLLCVGMTRHRDKAIVVVIKNPGDIQRARSVLCSGRRLCFQNGMYDAAILEWHYQMNVMQHIWHDTMLAQHAINPELPKGLDFLCSLYTEQPYYKDMIDWKAIKAGKQDIEDVWKYNSIDTWVTHQVMEDQLADELRDKALADTFRFEMDMLAPLWEMSKRGVRIDREGMKVLQATTEKERQAFQTLLDGMNGAPLNVMSNLQVGDLLFNRLGFHPIKRNKTGPACDDKTLAELALTAVSPIQKTAITLIRDIRKRRALESKFLDIEWDEDGRSRGMYNPGGTSTGRLNSTKFYPTKRGVQQQNIDREKKVRSLFLADSGKRIGYADLMQAESLVVAHLTNDPEMLRVHQPGTDAHTELAAVLFNKPREEIGKDSPERYLGKKTRHAGNYMQGPRRFMMEVNKDAHKTGVAIDYSDADKYIKTYRSLHQYLPTWWKDIQQTLWATHKLSNLLGRSRTFYDRVDTSLPDAVAFIPQSTVGDTLNVGFLALHGVVCRYAEEMGLASKIRELSPILRECGFETLMQIHDAVVFQYNEDKDEIVLPIVRQLLSVPLFIARHDREFTIPVEIKIGDSWGGAEEWKETQPQERTLLTVP